MGRRKLTVFFSSGWWSGELAFTPSTIINATRVEGRDQALLFVLSRLPLSRWACPGVTGKEGVRDTNGPSLAFFTDNGALAMTG